MEEIATWMQEVTQEYLKIDKEMAIKESKRIKTKKAPSLNRVTTEIKKGHC